MKKLWLVVVGLVVTTACGGVTENNYPNKLAKEFCAASKDCNESYFNEAYTSISDCRETLADFLDDDFYDDCDFDKKAAKDCLKSIGSYKRSCDYEELYDDSCVEVYDCPGSNSSSYSYGSTDASYSGP